MTLTEAYTYVDLLLDKANQPYFLNTEKDIFLNLCIKEFMDSRYALMRVNQDYSEMFGNRVSLNQNSAGYTITDNYVDLPDYYHITTARLNNTLCRIVSDDELSELRFTSNPFKQITPDNPACAVTTGPGQTVRLFFHHGPTSPDFTAVTPAVPDTFAVRYLIHLTVSDWNDIPEQYQMDVINNTVRKMGANIESSNYDVQVNEAQL
jgi:hypothetical protein